VEKLLSVSELAASLGLNDETVRRLTRSGELPHVKVGKSIRYRLSEVTPPSPADTEQHLLRAGLGVSSTGAYPAFLEAIAMSLGYPNSPVCDQIYRIADNLERIARALESKA
jgi:excisionase family DNA binding protein